MRYVTYEHGSTESYGAVLGGQVVNLPAVLKAIGVAEVPVTLLEYIAAGDELHRRAAAAVSQEHNPTPLGEVRLLAPIPRPRKNVFCLGLNYAEHVAEGSRVL